MLLYEMTTINATKFQNPRIQYLFTHYNFLIIIGPEKRKLYFQILKLTFGITRQ